MKSFLSNPAAAQHYGEKNQMPAYAERMTAGELELLVRWLTGDYAPTAVERYEDRQEGKMSGSKTVDGQPAAAATEGEE